MVTYWYTRTSRVTGSIKHKCIIYNVGEDISIDNLTEQIYEDLHLQYPTISVSSIKRRYIISNMILAPKCFGCLHDRMGQKEHMEHPDGCLHNADFCDGCI